MNQHELIITLRSECFEAIDKVASWLPEVDIQVVGILRSTGQIIGSTEATDVCDKIESLPEVRCVELGQQMRAIEDDEL